MPQVMDGPGAAMTARRVRDGEVFVYWAEGMDRYDPASSAVNGQVVRVKAMHGCPPPNTMGHCHIVDANTGRFLGLCLAASLHDEPEVA